MIFLPLQLSLQSCPKSASFAIYKLGQKFVKENATKNDFLNKLDFDEQTTFVNNFFAHLPNSSFTLQTFSLQSRVNKAKWATFLGGRLVQKVEKFCCFAI